MALISPVLTLSPEALDEDGVFRHSSLVQHTFARVADQEPLPLPQFVVCHTPLPADFCTCGRYALFAVESEALWDEPMVLVSYLLDQRAQQPQTVSVPVPVDVRGVAWQRYTQREATRTGGGLAHGVREQMAG